MYVIFVIISFSFLLFFGFLNDNVITPLNIYTNKQAQHHLKDQFTIILMILLLCNVIHQAVSYFQVFIVRSQTFLILVVQCKIVLLFICNEMGYTNDILIKVSSFKLILPAFAFLCKRFDMNLAKPNAIEHINGNSSDSGLIANDIGQVKIHGLQCM